jgi:hypothetical protein
VGNPSAFYKCEVRVMAQSRRVGCLTNGASKRRGQALPAMMLTLL